MSDNPYPYVFENTDIIPAGVTVSASVVKAQRERDAAYDEYGEAVQKYDDALRGDFLEAAQKRDAANARSAVMRGKSIDDLASEVERVQRLRGFAVGHVQALAAKVQQADAKIHKAWVDSLPDVIPQVRESLAEADKTLRAAESAYKAAKFNFRAMVNTLAYVDTSSRGARVQGDSSGLPGRNVRDIGSAPKLTGEPTRGWNEYSMSYNFLDNLGVEYVAPPRRESPADIAADAEPVRVRSLVNGAEFMAAPHSAAHLVESGSAEYV
ncbi:hypothetical protein ACWCQN_37755 [Streptomyces sp. NPDC001984]